MIQIRNSIFETNSSSTHSIIICSEANYKKFCNGEIMIAGYGSSYDIDTFIDRSSAIRILQLMYEDNPIKFQSDYECDSLEECSEDTINKILAEEEIAYTFDTYNNELETYEEHYTTEHGDKIVAFGYYGNQW